MTNLEARDLTPVFGSEVQGFAPGKTLDDSSKEFLQDLFDRRGVLVFRDLDLSHVEQVRLSKMLIRKEHAADGTSGPEIDDNFYISNRRPQSAAPFGRLQFHADTMWSDHPFEVLSLYAVDVEEPVVPTTFISGSCAWTTLPAKLRERVGDLSASHTAGEVRRGDLTDVLVSTVERPPSTVRPIAYRHPRTGETVLYVCEQMTKEVVGLAPDASEALLEELFAHLYDPAVRLEHRWRNRDLVVWDNLAVQHARPNVDSDGPARTLRKVASPLVQLELDEMPAYNAAD
jgi:alpha-ketoglutarate-dependent taurine dioxygenase